MTRNKLNETKLPNNVKTVTKRQETLSFGQTKPPAAKKKKTVFALSTKTEPPAVKKKKIEKTVFAL